jgi:hypothetical protein
MRGLADQDAEASGCQAQLLQRKSQFDTVRTVADDRGVVGDLNFEAGWTSPGRWTVSQALIGTGWRHVAVTYDGSSVTNAPVIYIDGTAQAVAEALTPTGALADNAGAGVIGNRSLFYDRNFAGRIDDVRIHDRVLGAIEIQALFDAGSN